MLHTRYILFIITIIFKLLKIKILIMINIKNQVGTLELCDYYLSTIYCATQRKNVEAYEGGGGSAIL